MPASRPAAREPSTTRVESCVNGATLSAAMAATVVATVIFRFGGIRISRS